MAIKNISLLFFLLFICEVSPIRAQTCSGTTCTANSCNENDVGNAISSAINGKYAVVAIPGGTCTWSSNMTSPASGTFGTLTIQGAGNAGCPSSCNDATTIAMNGVKWYLEPGTSGILRLSGITFESVGATTYGTISIEGPGSGTTPSQTRLDHVHCNMIASTDTCMSINFMAGVVDHSLFDETPSSEGNSTKIFWSENGDSGDQSWNQSTSLGSNDAVYFENDIFNHGVANDGQEGARFVFRFNTFNDTSVQTHPTGGDGRGRGARAWEIYNNSFVAGAGCSVECGNAAFISSGTGMVWGNVANNVLSSFVGVHSMRINNATYTQTATPNGWGYCGTAFNGTGSLWDHNTSAVTGYACMDQPGQGVGDLLSGDFPSVTNATLGSPQWPRQALEPVYEWGDGWNGTSGNFWPVGDSTAQLQSNRDFYLWCNTSSPSGCTSAFNGTVGTGTGTLAARPSTCATGVAYWATDQGSWNQSGSGGQGVLYKCTSTNTWTTYYTPYTYPHPLDGGSTPPPNAPGTPVLSPLIF